ncbi:hypothetical protein ACP70R_009963 [Stipagrostis hirtigluma subsp. patula]
MEFELFSAIGLILSTVVLLSPGVRLASLRNLRGLIDFLREPLLQGAQDDITFWLPSWFALAVATSLYWLWFFSWGSKEPAGTLLWSELNGYISLTILFGVVINSVLLLWVCILDHKKVVLCLKVGFTGFISFSLIALLIAIVWKRLGLHLIGYSAIALTVVSHVCRIMSSERQQFSTLALCVAVAGVIAGLMWIPKAIVVDRLTKDATNYGFWKVLFKKNFFLKVSLTLGSIIRARDLMFLICPRLAANTELKISQTCSWLCKKVVGLADAVQK